MSKKKLMDQEGTKMDETTLHPLSPDVIARQATINIGIIGHVAHGKSTVVKAISGVQMIAMRFGSVPIVRKTGSLNDLVFDVDDDMVNTVLLQFSNGFTFLSLDEQGVNCALDRAFNLYMKNNESWQHLVKHNMKIDFTYHPSAAQYVELYEMSVARARAATRP